MTTTTMGILYVLFGLFVITHSIDSVAVNFAAKPYLVSADLIRYNRD
ncbi:MAG: hypothetical protein R3C14_43650 [Caldilineaceae bacterium]